MRDVVILAAGASSRFWPLAQDHHKTLYPVGKGWSIFRYTLEGLKGLDSNIIVVAQPRDMLRMEAEVPADINVTFALQNAAQGEGLALLTAMPYLKQNTFYLLNSDKPYASRLIAELENHPARGEEDALLIATRETDTPSLYGITYEEAGRIKAVIEKPTSWPHPRARRVVRVCRLNRRFLNLLWGIRRSEYNFEEALNLYAWSEKVWSVRVDHIPETTLKYPWHLLEFNQFMMQYLEHRIDPEAKIESGAVVKGPVLIERNVTIAGSAVVRGPCVIREGAIIGDHALVRNYSYIGRGVVIGAHSEIKNSLIYDNTKLHNAHALDSIVDEKCNLGAGTRIGNTRSDGKEITSFVKGHKVSTGMKDFGFIMGKNSKTHILANIGPGVKIGQNCWIDGGLPIEEDVPDGHWAKCAGKIELVVIRK